MIQKVVSENDGVTSVLTMPCFVCKKTSVVEVPTEKFQEWIAGKHVQNAFGEMPPEQRELLVSGTHPKCWDEMFSEED